MKKTVAVSKYRPESIPPFKTLDEEADFWDTHDVSAIFENPRTPLLDLPLLETEKEESLTLRVQKSVKTKLTRVARAKGVNVGTMARMWIIERLSQVA